MKSLARTLMVVPGNDNDGDEYEDQEEKDARTTALSEVERHQRMDQWVPSYQNIISEAALEVQKKRFRVPSNGPTNSDHRSSVTLFKITSSSPTLLNSLLIPVNQTSINFGSKHSTALLNSALFRSMSYCHTSYMLLLMIHRHTSGRICCTCSQRGLGCRQYMV